MEQLFEISCIGIGFKLRILHLFVGHNGLVAVSLHSYFLTPAFAVRFQYCGEGDVCFVCL